MYNIQSIAEGNLECDGQAAVPDFSAGTWQAVAGPGAALLPETVGSSEHSGRFQVVDGAVLDQCKGEQARRCLSPPHQPAASARISPPSPRLEVPRRERWYCERTVAL